MPMPETPPGEVFVSSNFSGPKMSAFRFSDFCSPSGLSAFWRSAHRLRLPKGFGKGIGSRAVLILSPVPPPSSSAVVGDFPLDPGGPDGFDILAPNDVVAQAQKISSSLGGRPPLRSFRRSFLSRLRSVRAFAIATLSSSLELSTR